MPILIEIVLKKKLVVRSLLRATCEKFFLRAGLQPFIREQDKHLETNFISSSHHQKKYKITVINGNYLTSVNFIIRTVQFIFIPHPIPSCSVRKKCYQKLHNLDRYTKNELKIWKNNTIMRFLERNQKKEERDLNF